MTFKSAAPTRQQPAPQAVKPGFSETWLPRISWVVAFLMVAFTLYLLFRPDTAAASTDKTQAEIAALIPEGASTEASLPEYSPEVLGSVARQAIMHTDPPDPNFGKIQDYTVVSGDSIFGIAKQFNLKPETVLWANYSVLNDNVDYLALDQVLTIPPTDGVLYTWKDGDTLEAVASQYYANVQDILMWPGNHLDLLNPQIAAGTQIMIPGGYRETQSWVVATIPRGRAGVTTNIAGACDTSAGGAYGTGGFVWPADNHYLSGNDYWSGHLAVDIAAGMGATIYAADSGVVTYSGWNTSGYGNTIMIDHGNGYVTLYAHLSQRNVACGQSVYKGSVIGYAGSTGNSTGPHLHFEVRYFSGFVNPWTVLP